MANNPLDDQKKLSRFAKVRLEHLKRFPDACEEAMKTGQTITLPLRHFRKYGRIVFSAMGGSAIAADFIRDWMPSLPIDVIRDYDLPPYVTDASLVFAMSYSGSTDETLSAALQAYERRCNVFSVSCNGKLREYANMLGFTHIDIPESYDTQGSFPYLSIMPAIMLRKLGLAAVTDLEIREAADACRKIREECGPDVPERKNPAKRIARSLLGTIPVVYGPSDFSCVARRMKNYLNENAKVPARWDVFPELNHNEITGWDETGGSRFGKQSSIILLMTGTESVLMRERISASKSMLLKRKARRIIELKSVGESKIARLLSLAYMGDFITCYLALLYGRNPCETRYQKKMKDRLGAIVSPIFDQKAHEFSKSPIKPASSPELGKIA